MVKIDKSVPRPEAITQFLAGDKFTWFLKKHDQNLERLFWEFEPETMLAELASFQVHFENPEMQNSSNRRRATHVLFQTPGWSIAPHLPKVKVGEGKLHPFYFQ